MTSSDFAVAPEVRLTDHARLALHGIAGCLDAAFGHSMYMFVVFANRKPFMCHYSADVSCDTKFAESMALLRLMSGDQTHRTAEDHLRETIHDRIDNGMYWNRHDPRRPWQYVYNANWDGDVRAEDTSVPAVGARALRALLVNHALDPSAVPESKLAGLVGGLFETVVHKDSYSYYPDGGFGEPFSYPRSGWIHTREPESETEGGEGTVLYYQGLPIYSLVQWHRVAGDNKALDLAGRLVRFAMLPRFWGGFPDPARRVEKLPHMPERLPDPVCIAGAEQGHWHSHHHARAGTLRGILQYGLAAGDERAVDFVRRGYEFSLSYGIPRSGWINSFPAASNVMETCSTADMIALGIRLSEAGVGDYWDDVECFVRNQLLRSQLTDAARLYDISGASEELGADSYTWPAYPTHPGQGNWDEVIERSLGIFGSAVSPTGIRRPWTMQCCTANAAQALYYSWEAALREEAGVATVNLLFSRRGGLVDVRSFLPAVGSVEVENRSAARIAVRLPHRCSPHSLRLSTTGDNPDSYLVGRYLVIDRPRPGVTVRLDFPVPESEATYTACSGTGDERAYTFRFRGATVVSATPHVSEPTTYPLYGAQPLADSGLTDPAGVEIYRNW